MRCQTDTCPRGVRSVEGRSGVQEAKGQFQGKGGNARLQSDRRRKYLTQMWGRGEGGIFKHPQRPRTGSYRNITSLPLMEMFT